MAAADYFWRHIAGGTGIGGPPGPEGPAGPGLIVDQFGNIDVDHRIIRNVGAPTQDQDAVRRVDLQVLPFPLDLPEKSRAHV